LAITMSFRMGNGFLEQGNAPGSLHVPMVYEQFPIKPVHWEYHVMTVETREIDVPDTAQLNELGAQGWLLVGILDQRTLGSGSHGGDDQMTSDYVSRVLGSEKQGRSSLVHYYFVRQRSD
jgi:hypothetical protein